MFHFIVYHWESKPTRGAISARTISSLSFLCPYPHKKQMDEMDA